MLGVTLRVALVHDYLNQYGGAERVLEELHALFPSAPVYTSMYWPEKMSDDHPPARRAHIVHAALADGHAQPPAVLADVSVGIRELRLQRLRRGDLEQLGLLQGHRHPTRHAAHLLLPDADALGVELPRVRRSRAPRAAGAHRLPAAISQLRAWDVATAQNVDRFLAISRDGGGAHSEALPPRRDGDLSARQLQRVYGAAPARRGLLPHRLAADPLQAHRPRGRRLLAAGHSAEGRRQRRDARCRP